MSATRLEKGPSLVPPALEFEFRMRVQIGAPLDQGTWDGQRRRVMPIVGGTFEGPRFSGTILPVGADWQSVRVTDGVARIDARYTLRHNDGTLITMVDRGVRRGPLEVMARLAAGEVVEPSLYYFRTTPRFEVQDGPHRWLADHVFVCRGNRRPDAVELEIFRVL
jgi:hypothetical protein